MLGQHPQMYGLPETHLFSAAFIGEWWDLCERSNFEMADGLLRAIAELYFGEQTETTVRRAVGWLRRRAHYTTGYLLEILANRVHPHILVEASPSMASDLGILERAYSMFPDAKFIHLVQHPRGYGEAVIEAINDAKVHGPVPQWLLQLASYSNLTTNSEPSISWRVLHLNISEFLKSIHRDQKMLIRAEDLFAEPSPGLKRIAAWMGLRTDDDAVESMKHPEQSVYACFGPQNAVYGNDAFFLKDPALRPKQACYSLDGPLSWRHDGQGFLPEVKDFAQQFGYE
jgi:hypothetical protein